MKREGIISVFGVLSLVLVLSMILALLDVARIECICDMSVLKSRLATQNVISQYEKLLYEEYGLLGIDGQYSNIKELGEEGFGDVLTHELRMENTPEGERDFIRNSDIRVSEIKVELLTDQGGLAYEKAVSDYMTSILPFSAPYSLCDLWETAETSMSEDELKGYEEASDQALNDTLSAINDSENPIEGDSDLINGILEATGSSRISGFKSTGSQAILKLIFGEEALSLSNSTINENFCPSKRARQEGSLDQYWDSTLNRVSAVLYARCMFSNYCKSIGYKESGEDYLKEDRTVNPEEGNLKYQLEYILGGCRSDRENLEISLRRILFLRQGINLAKLMADPTEMQSAMEQATLAVGVLGNPALVTAVAIGILTAKAFSQAVSDVKTLVKGGKVALKSGSGLSYAEYLMILILLSGADVAYRSMDIIENQLNLKSDSGEIRLDETIVAFSGLASVDIDWLFSGQNYLSPHTGLSKTIEVYLNGEYSD